MPMRLQGSTEDFRMNSFMGARLQGEFMGARYSTGPVTGIRAFMRGNTGYRLNYYTWWQINLDD